MAATSAAVVLHHPTTLFSAATPKPITRISLLSHRPHETPSTIAISSSSPFPFPSQASRLAAIHPAKYSSFTDTPSIDPTSRPSPAGTLKSRLAAGETLYGLFLLSASPTLAEIAGLAGYDYVVVDMEHGLGGTSDALPCIRALAAAGTPAILRLPESSPTWAKKALDLGPQGVMFPMVETPAAAADAVSYCRFPPRGVRGSAHPVVRASAYGIDDGYLEHYEEGLLVMVQVETGKGVEVIEDIAGVEGVDCVQMGPLDLSASLGYLWEPGHRKVRQVLAEAERRVLEGEGKGKAYLGGFAMPHDSPADLKRRGYHMVSGAVDLGMFRQAAVEDVMRFRKAPGPGGEEEGGEHDGEEDEGEGYFSD